MIRRTMAVVLLVYASGFLTLSQELPAKWRSWRYSRILQTAPADIDSPAEILLPWEIYAHCRPGCADVRIVNQSGEEVPYILSGQLVARNVEEHAARIVENSFVADQYTQVIGDLGDAHGTYDRVKVETSRTDFIVWAQVALSDDAKTWRVVETRAPIARFRSRAVDGTQTIPFEGLSSRYVRVRIADPSMQFPVSAISVLNKGPHKGAAPTAVPVTFVEETSSTSTESVWRTTLASTNQPISELQVTTDTPEFYRAVRISGSSDGQEWSNLGSGVIYRYPQSGKTRELLNVDLPESTGNKIVRVEIFNGNDRSLGNLHLALATVPHMLLFRNIAGQQYRLLYGNQKASAPQYDLEHYLDSGVSKPVYRILALGMEQETADYRDPRPFTERHPELLWSALGAAILLIGLTAIKALRTTGNPGSRT